MSTDTFIANHAVPLSANRVTPLPVAVPLDPRTYDRALSCVHCGLCLPACPTYAQTAHEADSPRGRIQLMRALAEGTIDATPTVQKHLDLCLDCRACETACPSGVVYHELIEETRARLGGDQRDATAATPAVKLPFQERLLRWVFFHIFTHPTRLKWALLPARLMQKIGVYGLLRKSGLFKLLPVRFRKMEQMLPASGKLWPRPLPERFGGAELNYGRAPHATIVFFPGCVGSVMFDEVNRQAVELLAASGCEVKVPRALNCCGAIHHHNGAWEQARAMARRNIDVALPAGGAEPDFIVSTIAGCGAMLRDYAHLLRDDPTYAQRAATFEHKVRDISEVLMQVGLPEMKFPVNTTITYHDACHLAHAQKVTAQPRALLSAIPGLTLIPLAESDMCCGAAGTYNLTQPEMAGALAARKLACIGRTGASTCATGNVGCAMHLQSQADAAGQPVTIVHPVELIHHAVFGNSKDSPRG